MRGSLSVKSERNSIRRNLLYSIMLFPVVLLLKFLLTCFLSYTAVSAISWHELKWPRPIQPLSSENLLYALGDNDQDDFNATLDSILIPRVVGSEGHRKVRQYIVDSMNRLGWSVEEDSFETNTPRGRMTFTNVAATLNPNSCHRLVLACHYDSLDLRHRTFHGAIDSAVPCAQLIHLARVLDAKLKEQKEKGDGLTLQLIFFDGEEAFVRWSETDSLYGSRHLADMFHRRRADPGNLEGCLERSEILNDIDRMEVMVLLDLIGSKNPKFHSFYTDTQPVYQRLVDIESRLNDARQMDLSGSRSSRTNYFINGSSFSFVEDDHIPFFRKNVPIVHLIPTPFPSVWHTTNDNKENLHHPTISNLNKIFKAFVSEYLQLC